MKTTCTSNSIGKFWQMEDGKYHKEDGPACQYSNGDTSWYYMGKLHRLDGPAIDWGDMKKEWWYYDKRILVHCQEEFERWLRLQAFW